MDIASNTALTRQSALMKEMSIIANNIANANTSGFRSEGVIFSEYVSAPEGRDGVSMTAARIHNISQAQGELEKTGGAFDLAIEGTGFFLVETPQGPKLTRSGNFTPNEQGDLVTADGFPVLDSGGSPVFVPFNAGPVGIAPDGTISADGQPLGQIGMYQPEDPLTLKRYGGVMFSADNYVPAENTRIAQGFLEGSNVNPILQISRMIEVQRAYELGQNFLENEDKRIRGMIDATGR